MFAVGIDPSLTNTGIVALNSSCELIHSTILKSSPSPHWVDRVERIRNLQRNLAEVLLGTLFLDVDIVVLEGYSYGSRYQSHYLGELGFAYRQLLAERFPGRAYVVAPTILKKFITGKGNSPKTVVASYITEHFSFTFKSRDLSDACAAALFGLSKFQQEFFEKDQLKLSKTFFLRQYGVESQ